MQDRQEALRRAATARQAIRREAARQKAARRETPHEEEPITEQAPVHVPRVQAVRIPEPQPMAWGDRRKLENWLTDDDWVPLEVVRMWTAQLIASERYWSDLVERMLALDVDIDQGTRQERQYHHFVVRDDDMRDGSNKDEIGELAEEMG